PCPKPSNRTSPTPLASTRPQPPRWWPTRPGLQIQSKETHHEPPATAWACRRTRRCASALEPISPLEPHHPGRSGIRDIAIHNLSTRRDPVHAREGFLA